ncbi:MAG: FIST C-terminal domain-containing protein [Lachnospiraceae bacterium]|nr:FIST C-terminal domain-containing protein [Lachnospiraceae bacterium]
MKQQTLKTNDNAELTEFVRKLRDTDHYRRASAKFIYVCEPVPDEDLIKEHIHILSAELPDNRIIGISSCPSREKHRDEEDKTLFSFLTFENSYVDIFAYSCKHASLLEIGKQFRREVRYMDDIALCLVFSAGVVVEMDDFLNSIEREDFPTIGIEAGSSPDFSGGHSSVQGEKPLIFSERTCNRGIIAVVIRGKSLKVNYIYDIGWHPIGKEMTATETDGSYCISRIDDEEAILMYRKYLGVEPDRYFVENVREFPIVTLRGNMKVVRCPVGYDHNGRLYFISQVEQGHKIRLSYANPRRLVSDTRRYARSMSGFKPQALFLMICETRHQFLGDLAHEDIRSYSRANKELIYARGFAGIMKKGSNGGVVNSALIAVGLREGTASDGENAGHAIETSSAEIERKGAIPLNERLAMFLEETTRELEEAAAAAHGANEAKSSFLSNMSHEIRTPINAVLGMNEMIIRESKDPHVVPYAQKAYSASMNLLNIINEILDFSKIEAGKMDILPVEYETISIISLYYSPNESIVV